MYRCKLRSYYSDIPNIETYRSFRFGMYMEIMNDTTEKPRAQVFKKWEEICYTDMRQAEQKFIRNDSTNSKFMGPKMRSDQVINLMTRK